MLDRGRIHQGHVREIRDVSTCTAQNVGAATRSIWRDVTLPLQKKRKKTYPLQTCYEHNTLSLLHAVCLKVLVFFLYGSQDQQRLSSYVSEVCHPRCVFKL